MPEMLWPVANHLWQSTAFAGVAGLLTLALRTNRAGARYWVWMAALVKFVVPFSILVSAGGYLAGLSPVGEPASRVEVPRLVNGIVRPFAIAAEQRELTGESAGTGAFPAGLFMAIWLCGSGAVTLRWCLEWRRVRNVVRQGRRVEVGVGIPMVASRGTMEPGVFGIWRPVLVLPEGLLARLTTEQLQAIAAHEMCHVDRRDNLWAAVQSTLQAMWWFYPLVWWIGGRLLEERERACDEEVLLNGSEPRIYAEGILEVCRFCVEAPAGCVAGVAGGNLKKRIERIVRNPVRYGLDFRRKALLLVAGIAAAAVPLWLGIARAAQYGSAQFEVATVKPSGASGGGIGTFKSLDGDGRGPEFRLEHGRLTAVSFNLFGLIVKAYGLTGCKPLGSGGCIFLSGGPDWIAKEGFDVVAKAPEGTPDYTLRQLEAGRAPEVQAMLRDLLRERFQLKIHREKRTVPVYALTVRGKPLKPKKAAADEEPLVAFRTSVGENGRETVHLVVRNGSMREVTELYGKFMSRPVLDQTGLGEGRFDFTMDYDADPDGAGPFGAVTGPGLFRAFEEQGLKLVATSGVVEILLVDAARRPSGN